MDIISIINELDRKHDWSSQKSIKLRKLPNSFCEPWVFKASELVFSVGYFIRYAIGTGKFPRNGSVRMFIYCRYFFIFPPLSLHSSLIYIRLKWNECAYSFAENSIFIKGFIPKKVSTHNEKNTVAGSWKKNWKRLTGYLTMSLNIFLYPHDESFEWNWIHGNPEISDNDLQQIALVNKKFNFLFHAFSKAYLFPSSLRVDVNTFWVLNHHMHVKLENCLKIRSTIHEAHLDIPQKVVRYELTSSCRFKKFPRKKSFQMKWFVDQQSILLPLPCKKTFL